MITNRNKEQSNSLNQQDNENFSQKIQENIKKQQLDFHSTIQLKSHEESNLLGQGMPQIPSKSIQKRIYQLIESPILKIIMLMIILFLIVGSLLVYSNYYYCPKKNKSQFLQDNMCNSLKKYIKSLRFYDIHYFLQDDHNKARHKIILLAHHQVSQTKQQRQILPLTKTNQQYQQLMQKMINPWCRFNFNLKTVKDSQPNQITKQHFDLAYFFYELQKYPQNKQYKQVQYYRYNKIYNIGRYEKQLPICAVMVGKNNFKVIDKMYTSIQRQNYTNYKIVHVDDNSNDGTVDKIIEYLKNKPKLNGRVTLITQPYQRNALFNRNLGIRHYCGKNDIVLDMDADDWLIGSQVFQLVNSVYQNGNNYKGNNYQVWSAYFSFIERGKWCDPVPRLVGPIPQEIINNQTYRIADLWRTTHLRTYLKQLHDKMDENDFLDRTQNNGQFFVQTSDSFTQRSIVQLTAPKHMVILDQFVYYYQASPTPKILTEFKHSFRQSQALLPYYPLESLADQPKRHIKNLLTPEKQKQLQQFRVQIKNRRDKMEETIKSMYY